MNQRNLWAPWRLPYLETLGEEIEREKQALGGTAHKSVKPEAGGSSSSSFLSEYWQAPENDAAHFVIERSEVGFILLNRYPYSNGHLLVALGEARPSINDYDAEQRAALWRLVDRSCLLMDRALNPQGKNIGVNIGKAAGAGIPQHLHVHVVPRWGGDTNFITTVGAVRVVPAALEAMYERYLDAKAALDAAD